MRLLFYLYLTLASLLLFFFGIWQITPIIVDVQSTLGLASHFRPSYWTGLALIVTVSILVFLDRRPQNDAMHLLMLATLSQFLIGVVSFVYGNPRSPDTYFPITEVHNIVMRGGVEIVRPPVLALYNNWPGLHFISAFLVQVAVGRPNFVEVVRYTPVVFGLILVLIAYCIGKRLELASHICFILSFLSVTSWLFLFHYGNNAVAMLFYLLLFMMIQRSKNTVGERLATLIVFAGLVMIHSLASLAALGGLAALYVYRKETRAVLPFAVLFAAWYAYVAFEAAGIQAKIWLTNPLRDILELARVERYQEESALARAVTRYSQFGFVTLYTVLTFISIIKVFKRRTPIGYRRQVGGILIWTLGSSLVLLSGYGQVLARGYVFAVVPVVCIAVLSLSRDTLGKSLLVGAVLITAVLSLPANFGAEASWAQVLTTELEGSRFFALKVHPRPTDSYFQHFPNGANLIFAYDSSLFGVRRLDHTGIAEIVNSRELTDREATSVLDDLSYVILSRSGSNAMNFRLGKDPYATWAQSDAGKRADLVYVNGGYEVFRNRSSPIAVLDQQSPDSK